MNKISVPSVASMLVGGLLVTSYTQVYDYNDFSDSKKSCYSPDDKFSVLKAESIFNKIDFFSSTSVVVSDEQILKEFIGAILPECKSLEPEFSKLIDDNFWDLI